MSEVPNSTPRRPWLLIPILLPLLAVTVVYVAPMLDHRSTGHFMGMFGGPVICAFLLMGWWAWAMRGEGLLRWLPLILVFGGAVIMATTFFQGDPKWAPAFGIPFAGLLWCVWLVGSWSLEWATRRVGVVLAIVLAWCGFTLIRIDGTDAEIMPEISWRWQSTSAELYEQERISRGKAQPAKQETLTIGAGDWAEFRGPNRDNRLAGLRINTDWVTNPPKLLWKQRIGPGWGSFSVVGKRIYTQEQRRDQVEAIVCLDFDTGQEYWSHEVPARFYEQIAGAGPRSTPTIADGRLYAMGATGILTCLNAMTGEKAWEIDVTKVTSGTPPPWGYAISPLVTNGKVIVYVGGKPDQGTAAFHVGTGELAWAKGQASHGYASPQRVKLAGLEQVLLQSNFGLESFEPTTGQLLWSHEWKLKEVNRATQPVIVDDTDVIIGSGVGTIQASRRLHLTAPPDSTGAWKVDTLWTTKAIKPYFNDAVVHNGFLYGFDDKKFVCVDLKDGKQRWTTGNDYGHGQVVLLQEQGLLVVQAVDGKVALLEANDKEHVELSKFPALAGKTWNHPVIAHGRLLVRNAEQVACYELAK
ncbi:MAG: PQQ-binding-like beta-propeller repeat protein [Fimbriiglobus sp.]